MEHTGEKPPPPPPPCFGESEGESEGASVPEIGKTAWASVWAESGRGGWAIDPATGSEREAESSKRLYQQHTTLGDPFAPSFFLTHRW